MTPHSLGAAFVSTALVGGLVGCMISRKRMASEIAFAVSFLVGVAVLQCSRPEDLFRPLRPSVAADWLPMTVGLALVAVTITRRLSPYRIGAAVLLAAAATIRLLWGSVYLRDVSFETAAANAGVLGLVASWGIAMCVVLAVQRPAAPKRFDGSVVAWALATGLTAATITLTGSITYGALTGVVGVAALTSVVACGRLPVLAAIPVVSLVGLSVAFSEMPVALAAAILLAWFGLVATAGETSDGVSVRSRWVGGAVRFASVCFAVVGFGVVASQFAESSDSDSSGYGVALTPIDATAVNAPIAESDVSQSVETAVIETFTELDFEDTDDDQLDPFEGFGL